MNIKDIEPVAYHLLAWDEEDIQDGHINYAVDEIHREAFTEDDMNELGLNQWDFCECNPLYTEEQLNQAHKIGIEIALEFIPREVLLELSIAIKTLLKNRKKLMES